MTAEEDTLSARIIECGRLNDTRKQTESQLNCELFSRTPLKQHQVALTRRSRSVRCALEADLEWLSQMASATQLPTSESVEGRIVTVDEARMNEVRGILESELRSEKKLTVEMDSLEP